MAVPEKVVIYGPSAREKLFAGAFFAAGAVKSTIGPHGANAIIEKGMRVTNDGVTILREIQVPDVIEQMGVRKMQEIAGATNDVAGDGTTTATVLAEGILREADKFLPKVKELGSRTPIEIVNQIEKERTEITAQLVAMAETITSEEQLIQIAKVSVEDETLGELIGKAQWKLGADGYMLAEETNEKVSTVEFITGLIFDNGFGSSAIVNNPEKGSLDVHDVSVIYTNHTIHSLDEVIHVIQPLITSGSKNIVIISRAFSNEAIQECITNLNKGIGIFPLNAPYTDQAQVMKDMQALLGGRFIDKDETKLEDMQLSEIGHASFISAKRSSTVITGTEDDAMKSRVAARVDELKKKLVGETSEFEKKNLSVRMAQLQNGFALVKVGATTETERKYKKDKVDDAVNAVRAALQEGVVSGAGQAFKTISETMPAGSILKKALTAPYDQIRLNAPSDFVVSEWVKDPVKVLRVALEKACSVSSILSTISIAIATAKEKPRYMVESPEVEE